MDPNASKASPRKKPHNNVQISTKSQIPIKVDAVKENKLKIEKWKFRKKFGDFIKLRVGDSPYVKGKQAKKKKKKKNNNQFLNKQKTTI